jgi:hypothetical protein
MKLYTRPRSLFAGQLRMNDHVAMLPDGDEFVAGEAEYMDLDLRDDEADRPVWSVVHSSGPNTSPESVALDRNWVVVHTRGVIAVPAMTPVIVREVIELDPWSYVKPYGDARKR